MAFNVRVFGHRGTDQLPEFLPSFFNEIQPLRLYQPYEWAQTLVIGGGSSFTIPVPNDLSTLIKVEVADGQLIQYEIGNPGRVVGPQSPFLEGTQILEWSNGWVFNVSQPVIALTNEPGTITLTDETGTIILTV